MINCNLIKKLRELTGIGIIECKNALIQSNGNIEEAIVNMRKKGTLKIIKKNNKDTIHGVISIKFKKFFGAIVELKSETDFLSKNQKFIDLSHDIVCTALKNNIQKIKDIKKTFEKKRTNLILETNENIKIKRFFFMKGKNIGGYLHNKKIGVLISVTKADHNFKKQLSMHIAANNPIYLNQSNIPKEILKNEEEIQLESALNLTKNKDLAQKIALGKMKKFFNEMILMHQNYIFEPNKTIYQILKEKNVKIIEFIRYELGKK